MASGQEVVMGLVLDALRTVSAGDFSATEKNTLRAHRTLIPRSAGQVIHLIGGRDRQKSGKQSQREKAFTVSLFGRSDAGETALDDLLLAVMSTMQAIALPSGVSITPGVIDFEDEIGDADPVRIDIAFDACYPVDCSEWSLSMPS